MKKRVGVFAAQEDILFKKFKIRRIQGLAIDGEWFKTEVKLLVKDSDHARKDEFKASNPWLGKFCRRHGLSNQRKTNKKSKSVLERLPKVKNFHYYTVYKMRLEKVWTWLFSLVLVFLIAFVVKIKTYIFILRKNWLNFSHFFPPRWHSCRPIPKTGTFAGVKEAAVTCNGMQLC